MKDYTEQEKEAFARRVFDAASERVTSHPRLSISLPIGLDLDGVWASWREKVLNGLNHAMERAEEQSIEDPLDLPDFFDSGVQAVSAGIFADAAGISPAVIALLQMQGIDPMDAYVESMDEVKRQQDEQESKELEGPCPACGEYHPPYTLKDGVPFEEDEDIWDADSDDQEDDEEFDRFDRGDFDEPWDDDERFA